MENNALIKQREKLLSMSLAKKGIQRETELNIESRERGNSSPQSFAQQRLWFLDRLKPGSAAYNMSTAVRIKGDLDLKILELSLQEVVRRHEILRTTFNQEDDVPVQIVAPELKLTAKVSDFSSESEASLLEKVQAAVDTEAEEPFDLTCGPLLRMIAIKCAQHDHVLQLTLHHIIADGWSMGVLLNELMTLYDAYIHDQPANLPELEIQYADFSDWQREWLNGGVMDQQLEYWSEQLHEAKPLALPTDRPRGLARSDAGSCVAAKLPGSLLHDLKALGQDIGASLFMVCLAGFKALLARYSGQQDVVVGTPVWNRHRKQLEGLIGFFVNTLALRTDISDDPGFLALVERVRDVALAGYEHQDLPFERLVEALGVQRHSSDIPLLQVMFSMQNAPEVSRLSGLEVEPLISAGHTAKFDLSMNVAEGDEGLTVTIEYRTDIYDHDTVERMLGHYRLLLEAAVAEPSKSVSELRFLSTRERDELLLDWSRGQSPELPAEDVCQRFEQHAASDPDALAVGMGDERLSYGELERRSNQLAAYLRRQGVRSGDVVALGMERSTQLVLATLAVLKAGAAYLPLDIGNPAERLKYILKDAGAETVIGCAALGAQLPDEVRCICLDSDAAAIAEESDTALPRDAQSTDLAYVIYTSGSTGQPKGVEVEHAALANLASWTQRAFSLSKKDRGALLSGVAFDASVWELWPYLSCGAAVMIVDDETRNSPSRLIDWLSQNEVTVAFMPTPLAELCLQSEWPDEMPLRVLLTGGDVLHRLPSKGLPFTLYNNYGPTENTVVATSTEVPPGNGAHAMPPIGRPIDGVNVYVLDSRMHPVPVGVAGELYIGGKSLARGYRNNTALSAEHFVDDPFSDDGKQLYRTGDLVRFRDNGELEFLGRVDSQIKLRGYRIELSEIESALYQHEAVQRAAVVAHEVRRDDRRLVAYVECQDVGEQTLREHLKACLPSYMLPTVYVTLESLPLTINGKVDRASLPVPALDAFSTTFTAPESPTQTAVAEIWCDVLQLDQIGIHDNFFELGGHSLLAMQIISRVEKILNADLPLQSIFDKPSVAEFAAGIDNKTWKSDGFMPPPLLTQPRDPEASEQRFPQSASQQRLWFLEQLEPNTPTYNIPLVYRLSGDLDVQALRQSFKALIQRHEILRTTFAVEDDGQLTQVVKKDFAEVISMTNLAALPKKAREAQARNMVIGESRMPFNLTRGPLLRVTLLRFSAQEHILLIGMHHIITDAWSMSIFIRELSVLYDAYRQGIEPDLPSLPVQYADFSSWQDEWLQFGVLEELLFYWREHLLDAPPEIALMTDRPRSWLQSSKGSVVYFDLDADCTVGLKALARRSHATLFMVLLAAFKALLMRYSGQSDIVVGVPIANRQPEDLERLIGFFVNTLVMRTDLSGDPSFEELIGRVRSTALNGFEHQQLPFERLVEQLSPERRWHRSPLFQVMFILQNAPDTAFELPGLEVEGLPLVGASAKFDLTLSLQENGNHLSGAFEYNTDLFDQSTVERIVEHWRQLLQSIVADATTPITKLSLLPPAEQQRLLGNWSQGPQPQTPTGNVCDWFEQQAGLTPDALAVADSSHRINYGELNAQANRLAQYLRTQGISSGDVVAIGMERSVDMAICFMAILKAGAAYLPLDIGNPPDRLGYILENATAAAVLTRDDDKRHLPEIEGLCLCLEASADAISAQPDEPLPRTLDRDSLAYVIYTSGSTGRPKGVEVPHGALANLVAWQQRVFGVHSDDRASQLAGAAFDASLCEWWVGLCAGASVHVVDDKVRTSPADLIQWMHQEGITIGFMPTPLVEAAMQAQWPKDMPLRVLMTGGDALHRSPPQDATYKLYNIYGPAENAVATTCSEVPPEGTNLLPPSIGRPIDGVRVYVLDEAMQAVPAGVVGELYTGGESLALGYRGNSELTASRFVPDPFVGGDARMYRTGDQVRFRANGELEFLARLDDQVKIRGYRIELKEIESALRAQEVVKQAFVLVREDTPGDKRIAAYVVPVDGEAQGQDSAAEGEAIESLLDKLRLLLPDYMMPSAVMFLSELPKSSSGKVDRSALPKPARMRNERNTELVAPRDELEETLTQIWSTILDYKPVSMNHNFFDNGGHSLLALSLKSEVHRSFGVNLRLATLFENGTVENLARHIRELIDSGVGADNELSEVWDFDSKAADAKSGGLLSRLKKLFSSNVGDSKALSNISSAALNALVPIQPNGTLEPLFCIHPIGGGVLCYGELARSLDSEQPVYGLQFIENNTAEDLTIEGMAAQYVSAVKSVQPEGPYALSGWSLGGVIAFEMAQQLRSHGDEVALLALLDSYPFDRSRFQQNPDDVILLRSFAQDMAMLNGYEEMLEWSEEEAGQPNEVSGNDSEAAEVELAAHTGVTSQRLKMALDTLKLADVLPLDMTVEDFEERWLRYRANYNAWSEYKPQRYDGKLSLIMAADGVLEEQQTPFRGWGALAGGGMSIDVLPGNHYYLLRMPTLELTAGKLSEMLNRSAQGQG